MSTYRPNFALHLSNQLFASIQKAPRAELLCVELAAEHDIEPELVHRTLDRYVTSGWLDMRVQQRPLSSKFVRLYTVTHDYKDRPLLPADAPMRTPEPKLPLASERPSVSRSKPAVAPVVAKPAAAKPAVKKPAAPAQKAPSSEAAPSERAAPVEAVKTPQITPAAEAPPAATSKDQIMPRGVYQRTNTNATTPSEKKFSCALFDDDRLLVRAGGKSLELTPEETTKLAAYLDRIGAVEDSRKAA